MNTQHTNMNTNVIRHNSNNNNHNNHNNKNGNKFNISYIIVNKHKVFSIWI